MALPGIIKMATIVNADNIVVDIIESISNRAASPSCSGIGIAISNLRQAMVSSIPRVAAYTESRLKSSGVYILVSIGRAEIVIS